MRLWWVIRTLAAILSLLVLFIALCNLRTEFRKASPGIQAVDLNDYSKAALELRHNQMDSISQLTILVLGGIWGLAFGTSRKLREGELPVWTVFVSANISFLLSYYLYLQGNDYLIEMLYKAKLLDLESARLSVCTENQIQFFGLGLLISLLFSMIYSKSSEVVK